MKYLKFLDLGILTY